MDYEAIKAVLAPCGLNCGKCMANRDGEIRACANRLRELLGSFDRYAERFSSFMPVFGGYPQFRELLEHLGGGDCAGCRNGVCRYPGCIVPACVKDRGVDFCFQCGEFPCDRVSFDPDLRNRWQAMNARMKEIGIEGYFEETRDLPRYK
ncbi:MAG TPA: DUF3795 domain-containing protein [Deltaproteobacteria bacterium]|nr:DUF3795 domain-containing protein [Deltaproteobacteria bacterium]HPR55797.1 DUF3795 domain-containing protein [Deltaproteobacteria bacterium]